MKQLRGHIIIAAIVIMIYVALALWFDRTATRQHEESFNQQQALQVQLSAQSIEDHFEWLNGELNAVASYALPHTLYLRSPSILASMLEESTQTVYPDEELIVGYFTSPTITYAIYTHPDAPPDAEAIVGAWLDTYWDVVETNQTAFVTPFILDESRPIYGVLLPVFSPRTDSPTDPLQGIMVAMLDFDLLLDRYIIPMRIGQYGAAWVQDDAGLVIYDHEPETVGANVFDTSAAYPDLRRVIENMVAQDTGQDEYRFTVERGGDVKRKLVAWSTAYLGNQRLTVAFSSPDSEINANVAVMRGQLIALGVLLTIVLVASSSLIYWHNQRNLTRLVAERTQELASLTNQLEQRVTERTGELEKERAQLSTILEAMTDAVIFHQGSNIVYVNTRMTEMIGYSYDELVTNPRETFQFVSSPFDQNQHSATVLKEIQQTIKSEGVWRAEGQLKRKDGTVFDASIFVAEVRGSNGKPVGKLEIIRDTTEEKALRRQHDNFITNAAHELRGPLANLKTRLYLLKRQPEKVHEHVEVVDQAADQMTELVNDLMDMAQFMKGNLKLNRRAVDLQHILRSTISIQQPHAYRVRVDVRRTFPDVPIQIFADHQRLMQTFNSLLANAIHSTPPDGRVDLTVSLPNNGHSEWVTIQIHDNGPALDREQLTLIFEPFFRPSEGSVKRTGMDLALSKRIIEEHGGTIAVSSHPAVGTTFTVQLPLHSSAAVSQTM